MPSLSPNGRYVAFCSTACNLVRPDRRPRVPHTGPGLDPHTDVFVRDLRRGVTRRASSDRRGRMANAGSCFPSVADKGSCVRVRGDRSGARLPQPLHRDVRVGLELAARARRRQAARRRAGAGLGGRGDLARRPLRRVLHGRSAGGLGTDALGDAYLRAGAAPRASSAPARSTASTAPSSGTPHARHVLTLAATWCACSTGAVGAW